MKQGLAALTQEARIPIYQEIQQIVSDEVPFLYLLSPGADALRQPRQGLPASDDVLDSDNLYKKARLWSLDPAE